MAVTGLLLLGVAATANAQNVPRAGGGTGANTTTFTNSTRTIVNTTNKTEQVATFLTRLTARLDGGALVYDQSFPAAFSDSTVQAAITQARQALTTAAAPATPTITGPARLDDGHVHRHGGEDRGRPRPRRDAQPRRQGDGLHRAADHHDGSRAERPVVASRPAA